MLWVEAIVITPRWGNQKRVELGRERSVRFAACRSNLIHDWVRAKYRRRYRKANPEAEKGYSDKQRESRGGRYWKAYREMHPDTTLRNRANGRLRKRLKKAGLQRQLDIVQLIDPIEKLDAVVGFATSHRSLLHECLPRKCG
jgi:hypothetical protein